MDAMPLVSVIVAAQNASASLPDLAEQLERQTYPNLEVVVVNDASQDETRQHAQALVEAIGGCVVDLTESRGVGNARNIGLGACRGEFVWFIDCGDELADTAVSDLVGEAIEHHADIVAARAVETDRATGRTRSIDGRDGVASITNREALLIVAEGQLRGFLWSKLFRRSAIPEAPFPDLTTQSDFVGLLRIIDRSSAVRISDAYVYEYVRDSSSISSTGWKFDNLLRCEHELHLRLENLGHARAARARTYFSVTSTLTGIDTSLRLRKGIDPAVLAPRVAQLRSLGALRSVAHYSPRIIPKLLLLATSQRAYRITYIVARSLRSLRSAVSRRSQVRAW